MVDPHTPEAHRADLELTVGTGDVGLSHLVSASSTFAQLLAEVGKAYAGSDRDPIEWLVEVREGSVRLPLRGRPVATRLAPSATHEVADAVASGLATLNERAERPPYFTDRAIAQARALANLASDDMPIVVRNGGPAVRLTKQVLANADKVLGSPLISYGTVEGRLEALNIHGPRPTFGIYEPLTGHRVECYFGEQVGLSEVTAAVGKRVGARGRIKSRRGGERVSVDVDELRVLRDRDDLPPAEQARGILRAVG